MAQAKRKFTADSHGLSSAPVGSAIRRQVVINGLKIACYDSLPFAAERNTARLKPAPLLLLHGLCSLSYTWHEVFDELAVARRVIAVDLKGFGTSDKPAHHDYSVEAQADIVLELMNELQISRTVFAGNSLGGGIALRIAQRAPQRVSRLVLVNPATYHDDFPWLAKTILTASRAVSDSITQQAIRRLADVPGFIESRFRHAHYRRETVTAQRVAVYSSMLRQRDCQRAIAATLKSLDLRPVENDLPAVTQPALVIWGRYDRVLPLRCGERLARELPNADLRVLPCGHAPQEELPAAFVRLVNEYLNSTDHKQELRLSPAAQ